MPDSQNRPPRALRHPPTEEGSTSPAVQPQDKLRHGPEPACGELCERATAGSHYPLLATRYSLLLSYFHSGWTFLIPYLAAYLLYAWLKWPVNPVVSGQVSWVPCLLHVYWFLHAIHLVLGAIALAAWWRISGATVDGETDSGRENANSATSSPPSTFAGRLARTNTGLAAASNGGQPPTVLRVPSLSTVPQSGHRPPLPGGWPGQTPGWQQPATAANRLLPTVYRLLPWLCLALVFWIPGVYLEWPSDPWAHYVRIIDFNRHENLADVPTWAKSSYFFWYSLVGFISVAQGRLTYLNLVYTGSCLLLSWQYYRLARSIGLSSSISLLFILLQVLLIGNNVFGFYRYYGLSSSIYAQIGAVTLIRLGVEVTDRPLYFLHQLKRVLCGGLLLLLMGFNHPQALGIGGIGLLAVLACHLVKHRRKKLLYGLVALSLAMNAAAFLWLVHLHAFRHSAWLSPWLGFDFFSFSSPAVSRVMEIFGFIGTINFLAGLILIGRNHVVGWLTVLPVVFLALPLGVLPFALKAGDVETNLLVFHRLLLGMPCGLALIIIYTNLSNIIKLHKRAFRWLSIDNLLPSQIPREFIILLIGICMMVTIPTETGFRNRTWHALAKFPIDLSMEAYANDDHVYRLSKMAYSRAPLFFSLPGLGFVAATIGVNKTIFQLRLMEDASIAPPASRVATLIQSVKSALSSNQPIVLQAPSHKPLFTPYSFTGFISGHWPAAQVALERTGGPEIASWAESNAAPHEKSNTDKYFEFNQQ